MTVNLVAGTATDIYGNTDTLNSIENVYGSSRSNLSDQITGDANNNVFYGYAGADTLNGAGGFDTADYSGDDAFGGSNDVIAVGSAGGTANMFGGSGNDIFYDGSGTAGNDYFNGGTGSDTMYTLGGNDGFTFVAADVAQADFDQIFGFGAGDFLSFSASLNGQISGQQVTFGGISGSYLSTASGWSLWMPYTTWTTVQTQILYG